MFNFFQFRRTKKLVMTLLVRDEIDIIKKNINFHLSKGVDFIIATDNGSADGTLEVLKEYEKKGILHLIEEPEQDYSQAEWVNRMGKIAYEKYRADIIFHCDADEFWFPKSVNLKNELINKADANILKVNLINVLLEENGGQEAFPVDCKWAVINPYDTVNLEEDSKNKNLYLLKYPPKVIYKTKKGHINVIQGNHDIETKEGLNIAESDDMLIYHYPLRSKNHFFRKIENGGSAYEANTRLGKSIGFHWRRWYEGYKNDRLDEEYEKLILTKEQAQELSNKNIVEKHDFNELFLKP